MHNVRYSFKIAFNSDQLKVNVYKKLNYEIYSQRCARHQTPIINLFIQLYEMYSQSLFHQLLFKLHLLLNIKGVT